MKLSTFRFRLMAASLLAASMAIAVPAFAQNNTFVKVQSHQSFDATVSALNKPSAATK